jgi:NAD-dependent histone deacetylase SIR2
MRSHIFINPFLACRVLQLPKKFGAATPSVRAAGLVIVMGTSLQVQPFSMLPTLAENCPRLLINLNAVGDFGTRSDDVVFLSECDVAVQKLSKLLGWTRDLERLIQETKAKGLSAGLGSGDAGGKKDDAELLVEHLAEETAKKLKLDEGDATPKNPETKLSPDETPLTADQLIARQGPKAALPVEETTPTSTGVGLEPVSNTTPQTSTGDSIKSADTTDDTKSTS